MGKQTLDLATFYFLVRCSTADIDTEPFKSCVARTNATTIEAVLAQIPTTHKSKLKILKQRLTQLEEKDMAKTRESRAHDAEAEAASQIYQVAKAEAEQQLTAMREEMDAVRVESQAAGAIQAIDTTIAFQEFLKAITLQRIKQNKEYKKGGMTWVEFCESLGLAWRTVDLMLEDIRPIVETFSAKIADFTGMPFSKIRLLGKQISANLAEIENGCLIYGDESIPLTPEYRDDIQALIDRISEESREKVEEAEAQLSAKDKVLKSKQDLLNKQERTLRKFEQHAAEKGLTPDEDAFLQLMKNKSTSFEGYMLSMDPDFVMGNSGEITPRMRACLIATLHYMKMQVQAAYDTAVMNYGTPELNPEIMEEFEAWEKSQGMGQES